MRLASKLLWLLIAVPCGAQVSNPSIVSVTTAPSGACSAGLPNQQVVSTGTQYSCQNGTWGAIGGGGSSGLTVGTTTISNGTSGNVEYNNAGVLGEKGVTGTGSVVFSASPALTGTPTAPTQSCASNTDIATGAYVANCGSGATLQVNSVSNSSQTVLNDETSTANAVGLVVTPSNPSGGIVKHEITGTLTPAACPAATSSAQGCVTLGLPGMVNITSLITWTGCTPTGTPATSCIVGTAGTTITASSIPGGYSNLKIVGTIANSSGAAADLAINFDADTSSDYIGQQIATASSTVTGYPSGGTTTHGNVSGTGGSSAGSDPASFDAILPNYSQTTFYKTAISNSTRWNSSTSSYIQNYVTHWLSAAAISSFTLSPDDGSNLSVGSIVSVYGLP